MLKNKNIEFSFWVWADKLNPIISMLAHICEYDFWEEERIIIHEELRTTNSEKELWGEYLIEGKINSILFHYAKDPDSDIIFFKLKTNKNLKEKIEAMVSFQSIFKKLIE